ncbi:MAG: 23S rRNA (adenine(2503)-C(2))-methyltransferase RlmN, partial [Peptoniphilus sp.]|nr:23S rRNA (adenine(2503)-C(2))-methyltransferase RlmN [Peptoniphilus sp.]
ENIYKFADEKLPVTLALSLHNTDNKNRSELMPINRKYSIEEALAACKYYTEQTNTSLTVEYTLIKGVNDLEKNAQELRRLLQGINSHINLIPLNPIDEYRKDRPDNREIEHFRKKLEDMRLNVTIRRELGADINASCGQLRRNYKESNSDKIHSPEQ